MSELASLFSLTDAEIVVNAVRRHKKFDVVGAVQEFNHYAKGGNLPKAIRVQHRIIAEMSETIAHLEKANLMMELDYQRSKK